MKSTCLASTRSANPPTRDIAKVGKSELISFSEEQVTRMEMSLVFLKEAWNWGFGGRACMWLGEPHLSWVLLWQILLCPWLGVLASTQCFLCPSISFSSLRTAGPMDCPQLTRCEAVQIEADAHTCLTFSSCLDLCSPENKDAYKMPLPRTKWPLWQCPLMSTDRKTTVKDIHTGCAVYGDASWPRTTFFCFLWVP